MTEKAFRFDHGELRPPVELPNGFWRFDGYIARAGIYEYINTPADEKLGYGKAGTVRRELRPEEEVSRDDVLARYVGMSVTAQHPKQEVNVDNARAVEVGTVVEQPRWDAATKRVCASFVVKDRTTIGKVKKRELNELSPGYQAMIYKQPGADKRYAYPGNPEGRYDVVQRDIEPNHLALVKFARGGGDLCVRMDGFDDVAVEHRSESAEIARAHESQIDRSHETKEGDDMGEKPAMNPDEQIRLLKTQLDDAAVRESELKTQLATAQTRADAADAQLAQANSTVARLEAQVAAGVEAVETEAIAKQAARADEAEDELQKLKATREADIQREANVRVKAVVLMGTEFRCDGMETRQIQATVIKKFAPTEDVGEGKSDAYLATRFDALYDDRMKTARSHATLGSALKTPVTEVRRDSSDKDDDELPYRDQWKKGLKK